MGTHPTWILHFFHSFTEFTEELRLHTVYVLTFKSSVRVTCPTVLRENCDTAFQLFQKMSHYDAYLTRAKDDATDDTDSKTGEVLGRFSAKCAPSKVSCRARCIYSLKTAAVQVLGICADS